MSAANNPVQVQVDVRSPEAARAGLRTFFKIAEAWRLDVREQMAILGITSRTTLTAWRRGEAGALPRDTLERLSYIFGIYSALQVLLPTSEAADGWIRKPNDAPLFGGRSALDRIRAGNVADLFLVRQYLDAQRGGWS
jgi:hypothetical protein